MKTPSCVLMGVLWVLCFLAPGLALADEDAQKVEVQTEEGAEEEEGLDGLVVFPLIFYTPETSAGVAAYGGYYKRLFGAERPSSATVALAYTWKQQLVLVGRSELWLMGGKVRPWGEAIYLDFPNEYYGIGRDTPGSNKEEYNAMAYGGTGGFDVEIFPNVRLGPDVQVRVENPTELSAEGLLLQNRPRGWEKYFAAGVGGSIIYDDRSRIFDTREGTLISLGGRSFRKALGSDMEFWTWLLDARHFIPLGESQALGFQVLAEGAHGNVPIQFMAKPGGVTRLRGIEAGRFRDRTALYGQAEYRFPLWWKFRGVAFAGATNLAPELVKLTEGEWKPVAGGGIRFPLNDEGVNIRLDMAMGEEFKVYFNVGEAF